MIIKLDTDTQQTKLINKYLENKELNLIEKIKDNIMEIIEDYEDLKALNKAIEESTGETVSHKEFWSEVGL